jgi:hypothetical protein
MSTQKATAVQLVAISLVFVNILTVCTSQNESEISDQAIDLSAAAPPTPDFAPSATATLIVTPLSPAPLPNEVVPPTPHPVTTLSATTTQVPTRTPTLTRTPAPLASTATTHPTPVLTETPVFTVTITLTHSTTLEPSATVSPDVVVLAQAESTPTNTATPMPAPSWTATPTSTPTPTHSPTLIPTQTATLTPTGTSTATAVPTVTTPPTRTPLPTSSPVTCDYSGTTEAVIKGNIGSGGEKIYHTPDSSYYSRTIIELDAGERWFCAVTDAIAAGWRAPLQPTPKPSPTPTPTKTPTPARTATPAPTVTPSPTTSASSSVVIVCIFFDGVASRQEPDEYVEIVNQGTSSQDLTGWHLTDVSDDGPTFISPSIVVPPSGRIRVFTNEVHLESGGLSFERGSAIWSNSDPDTAGLLDASGDLVSTRSYPPGC